MSGERVPRRRQLLGRARQRRGSLPRVVKEFHDGHYYSAIPDLDEIERREAQIFTTADSVPGIDLATVCQLALVDDLGRETATAPFSQRPAGGVRYGYDNEYFGAGDALVWYGMLRLRRPRRVVEVGSGWSSAVLLDAIDSTDGWTPEVVFIEPNSERLQQLVRDDDHAQLYPVSVQEAPRELFEKLQGGDVLFIDSTHSVKVGSDVNLLLLEIVPSLPTGVVVHVHDIFYPFEYPKDWIFTGRAWSEAYLLRALLVNNHALRIVWWNHYLAMKYFDTVARAMPMWANNTGGSIYLETT